MSLLSGKKRNREITLFMSSPSLPASKIVQLVTCDDKKIDFGSIAKAFGLDPSTVKLNGYFISRGIDLLSSSLTWNSLLSFFSVKGLSTGKHNHDALLVTGKVVNNGMFCWFLVLLNIMLQLMETFEGVCRECLLVENVWFMRRNWLLRFRIDFMMFDVIKFRAFKSVIDA